MRWRATDSRENPGSVLDFPKTKQNKKGKRSHSTSAEVYVHKSRSTAHTRERQHDRQVLGPSDVDVAVQAAVA